MIIWLHVNKACEHMIDEAKLRRFNMTAELARNRESHPIQYLYENKPAFNRDCKEYMVWR